MRLRAIDDVRVRRRQPAAAENERWKKIFARQSEHSELVFYLTDAPRTGMQIKSKHNT